MPSQASKTELRAGSMIGGKYKLQRQIGRGASGAVWSAVNVATSRQVALKVLIRPEPKARERLLREARAAGALKHPNVVDVYDVIVAEDGSPALVLEFLEGMSLEQLIFERAPLPPIEVGMIGRDVARALAVAHASGIVHRDLKPANIFLHRPSEEEETVVKVVDFGISKNLLAHEQTLTETGMAVGSPSFMSPEQVRGERNLDGRTDLWALGVIMYEMLRGKRLFDGRAHEVLTLVLTHPIKSIGDVVPNLDPTLTRVVMGLLERDLGRRLASAEDVATALASYVTAAREAGQRPTEAPPSRGQARDTSLMQPPNIQVPKATPLPKIHLDDEEEEATHVAPLAMKTALAKKTAVPSVYEDEEEDEDRTRVAPDAVLTAAIQASRETDDPESNQNAIPTVRPPGLDREDGGAESTIADPLPTTANGTQKMTADKASSAKAGSATKTPIGGGAKVPVAPAGAKAPVGGGAKVPVAPGAKPVIGKAPVGPPPPARGSGPGVKPPIEKTPAGPPPARAPLGQKPAAAAPIKVPAGKLAPPTGPAGKPAIAPPPPPALHDLALPHSERTPAAGTLGPISERLNARSERPPSIAPSSHKVPVVGPPDADVDEEAISERSPSVRPAASVRPPEGLVVPSELPVPPAEGDAAQRRPSFSGQEAHAPSNPGVVDAPIADIQPVAEDPAAPVEQGRRRFWSDKSDALVTWLVTLLVAALLILAAYLYTHRS
ncbi:MAG: protein kinase [Polyangiaceae bacterium]